jgi:hypothetical protein|tara:strand:- start:37 stop:513 length:477 start_codon:yes stop_codon:yes gene_type:complete
MKKTKSKKVNVRKQLKIRLENTETRHKNKKGFRPTDHQAYQWFRVLNRSLFNSRLPMVPLHIRKLHKDWGRCVVNWDNRKTPKGTFDQRVIPYHIECDYFIELHCKFPKWKDFIETLAHEMVHLYQMTWLKDPYSNHNKNFFAWRTKFARAGLNLARC